MLKEPSRFEDWRVLLAALPSPAVVADARGAVLLFNPAAQSLFSNLHVGQPISFALRIPEVLEAVRDAGARGERAAVEYYERVPIDRWTQAHIAPLAITSGERAILIMFQDMTQLRRSERTRADFIANASHELRTPLASLLGFIETLQGPARADVSARDRFLEIMRAQAGRMARLIDDLLSLSRIEQKQHEPPRAAIDLADIVAHVRDSLAPLASERGVKIEVAIDTPVPVVTGDRDELIRVVENLMENAIKYGHAGERVAITVREVMTPARKAEVHLDVRDFGPGIALEHLPRLTERFYRVDVTDSREKGGTGLGLALVKHIMARHRGRLVIESVEGEGALFSAIFPRRQT